MQPRPPDSRPPTDGSVALSLKSDRDDSLKSPLKGKDLKDLRTLRREGTYRYEKPELDALIRQGPEPSYPWPGKEETERVVAEFQRITGDALVGGQWKFLRACIAIHGPDTVAMLEALWQLAPTKTNLLADLRVNHPRQWSVQSFTEDVVLPVLRVVEPAPSKASGENDDWDLDHIPTGILDPRDGRKPTPNDWVGKPCTSDVYRDHQDHQFQTADGWWCSKCNA